MCPVCEGHAERLGATSAGYSLLRCCNCGLRFSDPMKGEGPSSHIYERRSALIVADPAAALHRAAQRWNIQTALAELGPPPRRLLDIGCGTGQFLALAARRGHEVAGLDFNPDSLRVAREAFGLTDLFCGSLDDLLATRSKRSGDPASAAGPGRFDAVTALEVLEHTEEPLDFLRQLRRLLAPGGQLFLSVPAFERWPKIFDPEVDFPPHHLTLWTQPALARALERAGLRPLRIIRCPLRGDDLLRNVNLRLQRLVFREKRERRPAEPGKYSGRVRTDAGWPRRWRGWAWQAYARLAGTTARELVRASFYLPAALLRLHPRAGGFGLFAVGVRPESG